MFDAGRAGTRPFCVYSHHTNSNHLSLFLPPLMAGAIAQEKERDTLGLLFLT